MSTNPTLRPVTLEPLLVRPDPVRSWLWAAAASALLAAGIWLAVDSGGDPFALVAVSTFVVVAAWFIVQAVLPSRFTVLLDATGIHLRLPWMSEARTIRWNEIHLVRVNTLAGDPFIEIQVRTAESLETRGTILPVGADVPALHRWLDARYGG